MTLQGRWLRLVAIVLMVFAAGGQAATVSLPDGSEYTGPLVAGKFHGKGRMQWSNGRVYEGEFKAGLFDGNGSYQRPGHYEYVGSFKKGDFSGFGRLDFGNGVVYEGDFVDGEPHGQGTRTDSDSTYVGQFEDGQFHGEGVLTFKSGERYAGRFDGNAPKGEFVIDYADGSRYEGEVLHYHRHGHGRLTEADGGIYIGQFVGGQVSGRATYRTSGGDQFVGVFEANRPVALERYIGADGSRYRGEFEGWEVSGRGEYEFANGDRYVGQFRAGLFHGEGEFFSASATTPSRVGLWRLGRPFDPVQVRAQRSQFEQALYRQPILLRRQAASLHAQDPSKTELYVLAIAGDGSQAVFGREVTYLRDSFASRFDTARRTIVLANSRQTMKSLPMATESSIRSALRTIGQTMDLEQDILFVYLTSHGSSNHELQLSQPGTMFNPLSSQALKQYLDDTGFKWRVVVVSACFSGGFIDALGGPNTLVLTASSADRRSFGCSDDSEFTYFGRELLAHSILRTDSFESAFALATERVHEREQREDKKPSMPQIHAPVAILEKLRQWRQELAEQASVP